jgi:glycosyltransferase involved in cell wall biosynthesis
MSEIISVVIPVYNGEKTIRFTLESVLQQTFSNIEVIIIDDGSTDLTLEVIKTISDARIKVFSYVNSGLAASRNRGIDHANGKYISFIDADDLWTSDKLEYQLQALSQFPQAYVAYSWTDYIDINGNTLFAGKRLIDSGNVFAKMLQSNILENGSNPLVKNEAFKIVGKFNESLSAAEDWDMWLRLAAEYEFVCVQKPQILYRISANSMSTNLKKQEAASLEVIDNAFKHDASKSLQHLKEHALANIYRYLTFKSLDASLAKPNTLTSIHFFWNWVRRDSAILNQPKTLLIAILKIVCPQVLRSVTQVMRKKNS